MPQSTRRAASCFLVISLVLALLPAGTSTLRAQEAVAGQGPQTATIAGRVFGADRVTPIQGAVVRAVRGEGAQIYSSLPTDPKGNFSLKNLALGSYDIVVELRDGIFVVERILSISQAKTYSLSLATVPAENVEKKVAAVDKPVRGYAWTLEGNGPKAGGFWRTPGGIAIIAGSVAGLTWLALSGDDDDDNKGSASTP